MSVHAAAASGETTAFRAFLDRDWQSWLNDYPELGTFFGYPGHNDRWTDDSPAGIARRQQHLNAAHEELRGFRREDLSERDRVDQDLYRDLIEDCLRGSEFGEEPNPFHFGMPHNLWMPINQMEGVHLAVADLLVLQPRGTLRELEDVLTRLRSAATAVGNNLGLMRAGLDRGYSPPKVAIHGVPAQVLALIPEDPWTSPLLEPFASRPSAVSEGEWTRLRGEAAVAYSGSARPALQRLQEYLVNEYLPKCRSEVGVSTLPNGAAAYEHLIRWQTTTSLTSDQIHSIGLAELERIHADMEKVRDQVGFHGTLLEFFAHLRSEPKYFLSDPNDLIEKYRALGKRADAGLPKIFGILPRLPYGVDPMPAFKAPSSPGAYYQPGAPADGRAGIFYANTYNMNSRPTWEMEDLLLHEAVPGHHLQVAISDELDGQPSFRRHSGYTAFIEGWGLYAETLGEELGFFQDPFSKMGQLIADAWRSVRLVVDTGMHAKGWSRERAVDFFTANAGRSKSDIIVEIDRYIVWPGQALAYKIGQLKFSELRDHAEQELGDRFDIRKFHDVLLGEGGLPLGLVEARVERWIVATRAGTSP